MLKTKSRTAAGITHGAVFRTINKTGRIWGDGMTPKVLLAPQLHAASIRVKGLDAY